MGDPTFVLVPGAGGAAWIWHRVVAELVSRDALAVAVDLPAADPDAGIPEYVDAVAHAVGHRQDLVMVGMSLGGFTASAATERLPVVGLVMMNAMIPAPGETAGEWWAATGQSAAMRANDLRDGRDPDAGFDEQVYFFHDVSDDLYEQSAAHEQDESEASFATPWPLRAWPDLPTRVVAGRDDRLFPVDFQRRVARERLGLDVVEVPGGHLAPLSHPVEVTDELLRPFA